MEDGADNLDGARKLRGENKSLRERSKTAEAERDAARAELDVMRRQTVDRIVAAELRDARDFHDRHPDATAFLGDDGQLDADAVLTAAQALAAERPHYAVPPAVTAPPTVRSIESLRPGASPVTGPVTGPSWDAVLSRAIDVPVGYAD